MIGRPFGPAGSLDPCCDDNLPLAAAVVGSEKWPTPLKKYTARSKNATKGPETRKSDEDNGR